MNDQCMVLQFWQMRCGQQAEKNILSKFYFKLVLFPSLLYQLPYCGFVNSYQLLLSFFFPFCNFFQMSPKRMDHLLNLVGRLTQKTDTNRKAIPPPERLMFTLHYLALGDSQRSPACLFRTRKKMVSCMLSGICKVLVQVLQPLCVSTIQFDSLERTIKGL